MNLGKTLKYAVAGLITAGILTVLFLCGQKASATAKERTCSGVEVEFFGNDGAHFITGNDVKSFVDKDIQLHQIRAYISVQFIIKGSISS